LELRLTGDAVDRIRQKGGVAAIDFIPPVA
jgi:hypothetical protein